jgi:hypothetical protein
MRFQATQAECPQPINDELEKKRGVKPVIYDNASVVIAA